MEAKDKANDTFRLTFHLKFDIRAKSA
jgi:hypothetical protein